MCKRRNTSTSRVLFWKNTTTFFCIDVQKAHYICKSGAILKQHYSTFLYWCAKGAIHPQVGCYFEATLQDFFVSMCKRRNTTASRVLLWTNTTSLFYDSMIPFSTNTTTCFVEWWKIYKNDTKNTKKTFPENQRKTKESLRKSKENLRKSKETERKSKENLRKSWENQRKAKENLRKSKENQRKSKEHYWKSKEDQRKLDENHWKSNENLRISNENQRKSKEKQRKCKENQRKSNGNQRKSKENYCFSIVLVAPFAHRYKKVL